MLSWAYSIFDIKLLTLIAAAFTIYFGYQKVSTKVCVSYRMSSGKLYDTHIKSLVLSNKRDNAIAISAIVVTISNKGRLSLVDFISPLVLKGYDTVKVDVPLYSYIYRDGIEVKMEVLEDLNFHLITMSGRKIDCVVEYSKNEFSSINMLTKSTSTFNDIVITPRMAYIFLYVVEGDRKCCIIDKHGLIFESCPFHCNVLQSLDINYFEGFLVGNGYHDYFSNYMMFKVDDALKTMQVLDKGMVNAKLKKSFL